MRRILPWCLVAAVALPGCGGDDGTGPGGDSVTFPPIDAAVLAAFCIRGETVPPTTANGTIDTSDCHSGVADDGYFEGWRVRVAERRTVTFAVDSGFDSYLELYVIRDLSDPEGSAEFLGLDDDSGPGLDASLSWTLDPDTEYVIFVSGWDDSEGGPYALNMS